MRENAAMIAAMAVVIGAGKGGKDCFQRLWAECRDSFGEPGEVGDSEHANVAGAPRLYRQPIDEITDILNFEGPHELIEALGFAAAADIENRMHVAAADKERRITAFHVAAHRREAHRTQRGRLEIFVVGVGTEYDWKSLCGGRTKDIAIEQRAVRHADFHVTVDRNVIFSLRRGPLAREHVETSCAPHYLSVDRMSSSLRGIHLDANASLTHKTGEGY